MRNESSGGPRLSLVTMTTASTGDLVEIAGDAPDRPDRDGDAIDAALKRALGYLGPRARTERQVLDKLAEAGVDPRIASRVLARLHELALVDDDAFARAWVEERAAGGKAPDLILRELRARGVAREVAERAVAEVGPDETTLAIEVAEKLYRRVARYRLRDQAERLLAMLMRRGFSQESAEAGVRAVLPPDGWD